MLVGYMLCYAHITRQNLGAVGRLVRSNLEHSHMLAVIYSNRVCPYRAPSIVPMSSVEGLHCSELFTMLPFEQTRGHSCTEKPTHSELCLTLSYSLKFLIERLSKSANILGWQPGIACTLKHSSKIKQGTSANQGLFNEYTLTLLPY